MALIQEESSQDRSSIESRFNQKVSAVGPVWFKTAKKIYSGYLVNISREGITLQTRDLPEPNEEIVLSFQLPPSNYVFNLRAVVGWVSGGKNNDMPGGMGVRFIETRAEDDKHLTDYINRYLVP